MKQSMILLHGLFGGLSNWAEVKAHFGTQYDIRIPALPIYDQHQYDNLEYLVDFLEQFINDEKLAQVILIGNSLGGHVAILYTHRNPHKVDKLILTGSSGLYENTMIGEYPKRGSYNYIRERVANIFYDEAMATAELVDEVLLITTNRQKCLRIVQMAKSAQRNQVLHLLPDIQLPVLLIWGEDDPITPWDVAMDFNRHLPQSTLRMLPQCGHVPMMERPAEFNRILEDFLQMQHVFPKAGTD